jgi:hypothetical protein
VQAVIRRSMSLLLLVLGGVTVLHADVCAPVAVDIRMHLDPSIASRRITDRLKDEAEAIWRQYGIQLEWTDADAAEPAADRVSLDATVEGRFEAPDRMAWVTVLGSAIVQFNPPSWQPIRVSVGATESVLQTVRPSIGGHVRDHELARALGRVLAHEIGHVLLGAPYHDRTGLMRATFRPDELAEPNRAPFRLTRGSVSRLKNRLPALTGSEASGGASCIPFNPRGEPPTRR